MKKTLYFLLAGIIVLSLILSSFTKTETSIIVLDQKHEYAALPPIKLPPKPPSN